MIFMVLWLEDIGRKEGFECIRNYLRLRHDGDRRLEVVGLQVALEVEDLELVLLRERQQLAERRIRLDDLLVHQRVGLGVAADLRRHLRAGERRALGDTEELAERVRDGRRLREDRLLLDDRLTALRDGGSATTATLGRLLQLAGNLLLELLHVREDGAEHRAQGVDLLHEGVEVLDDVDLLGDGGDDGRRRNGDGGGDGDRGGNGDGGGDLGGCSRRGGGGGLLSGGTLGRGGGRAHVVICVTEEFFGSIKRGEYLVQLQILLPINFVHRG